MDKALKLQKLLHVEIELGSSIQEPKEEEVEEVQSLGGMWGIGGV